jgi:choline transport protein
MIITVLLNGTMGFLMLVMFCITDLPAALASETGYPFIYVFYHATQSKSGTIAVSCIPIVLAAAASATVLTTASRQVFAFARDGGLPFATRFASVWPNIP